MLVVFIISALVAVFLLTLLVTGIGYVIASIVPLFAEEVKMNVVFKKTLFYAILFNTILVMIGGISGLVYWGDHSKLVLGLFFSHYSIGTYSLVTIACLYYNYRKSVIYHDDDC
jgi:hypothetical protein